MLNTFLKYLRILGCLFILNREAPKSEWDALCVLIIDQRPYFAFGDAHMSISISLSLGVIHIPQRRISYLLQVTVRIREGVP